ncbi:MAG TPA: GNAT family N-acetyltransferase [Candidatus Omnitrophica bacterium]|nr:GNAT family N-acetyltransferase [Candidatus Omnitrophota bacterium]
MNEQVKIRRYRHSDRDALMEITIKAFDGVSIDQNIEKKFGIIGNLPWQEKKKRHIEQDIRSNPGGIWIAELEGEVVGYITTQLDYRIRIGYIPNLAVKKGFRGKGIGKKLFSTAFNYLKKCGMEYVRIETLEQNIVASKFYPKKGFEEIGRQIHYIRPL